MVARTSLLLASVCVSACATSGRGGPAERTDQREAPPFDPIRYCADPPKPPFPAPRAELAAHGLAQVPHILVPVLAPYPEAALREQREGTVSLVVMVTETGSVARADVATSAGADLDAAAIHALLRFKFAPACSLGRAPVRAWILYKYAFKLKR